MNGSTRSALKRNRGNAGWNIPAREPAYYQERLRQARESTDPELQSEIPQLEADYLKAKNEALPRALDAARQAAEAVKDEASDATQRLKTIRTTVTETLGCFPESQSLLVDLNAKIAALEAKERKKIAEADVDSLLSGADTAGGQTDTMLGRGDLGVDLDTMLGGEGEDFGDDGDDFGQGSGVGGPRGKREKASRSRLPGARSPPLSSGGSAASGPTASGPIAS